MYNRGIGSFEVELSSRRVAILHRLLNSQILGVREEACYLYTSKFFQFNASFLVMGTHLDEGDPDQSKNDWGELVLPSPPRNIPIPPSIYSCLVASEINVCVLAGNSHTFKISIRDLSNISKERERVLLQLASVGVAASNFSTSHSLVYTKYKSLPPLQISLINSQIPKDRRQ